MDPLFELLGCVFSWLPEQERAARKLGLRWTEISRAFLRHENGRAVAHVGVLELPLVLDGREVTVGGVHAVATHPDHRRRGHCRALLEEALAWCDERYETLLLTAGEPAIYERFGFRVVPESLFVGACGKEAAAPARVLDFDRGEDRALLDRLLATRAPMSRRFGVKDRTVILFNEARRPLRYAADLDCIVSCKVDGTTMKLYDVIAPEPPSLKDLVARAGGGVERIEAYFSCELLAPDLEPEPYHEPGEYLMVRGPFAPEGQPLMLAFSARC